MWQNDPLLTVNPRRPCAACNNKRRKRRSCEACERTGYERAQLGGLWRDTPGFLVCGGPSLNSYPLERLRERGVVSLGINQAAAHAPCSAQTFGDPQWKFHHSIFLDPKVLTFAPTGKLGRHIRWKAPDGSFRFLDRQLKDCPGLYGVARSGRFKPETFLTDWFAHWGRGGKGSDAENRPFTRLSTMLMGLRLLHYLGCPRVYMLGVDFHWEDKAKGYAWGQPTSGGLGAYKKIDTMLTELRDVFAAADFHVFNCSAESRCEAFPHRPWDQAITDAKGLIGPEPFDLADWYGSGRMKADREANPEILPEAEAKGGFRGLEGSHDSRRSRRRRRRRRG